MRGDGFFHPDDAVPAAEFAAAVGECANLPVAHAFMEMDAGGCQVGVLRIGGGGDAGIETANALCGKQVL